MNIFAFDIESVPDVETGRRPFDVHDLTDKDVAIRMLHKRRQEMRQAFLKLHLRRIPGDYQQETQLARDTLGAQNKAYSTQFA